MIDSSSKRSGRLPDPKMVGLRDQAILVVLVFTAACAGAYASASLAVVAQQENFDVMAKLAATSLA